MLPDLATVLDGAAAQWHHWSEVLDAAPLELIVLGVFLFRRIGQHLAKRLELRRKNLFIFESIDFCRTIQVRLWHREPEVPGKTLGTRQANPRGGCTGNRTLTVDFRAVVLPTRPPQEFNYMRIPVPLLRSLHYC